MVDSKIHVANINEGTSPSVFAQCMDKVSHIRDNIVEIVQKIDTKSTERPIFKDIQNNYVSVQNQIKECKSVYDQYKELLISHSEIKAQFANRIEYLAFQIRFLTSVLNMSNLLMTLKQEKIDFLDRLISLIDSTSFIPDFSALESKIDQELIRGEEETKLIPSEEEKEPITGEGEEKPLAERPEEKAVIGESRREASTWRSNKIPRF